MTRKLGLSAFLELILPNPSGNRSVAVSAGLLEQIRLHRDLFCAVTETPRNEQLAE